MATLDFTTLVSNVIRGLTGLLGVFVVSQLLWGIFLVLGHDGNEDDRINAHKQVKHALIGLVVVISSSSLIQYVVRSLIVTSGLSDGF